MNGILSASQSLMDILTLLQGRSGRLLVDGPRAQRLMAYGDGQMVHVVEAAPDGLVARASDRLASWGLLSACGHDLVNGLTTGLQRTALEHEVGDQGVVKRAVQLEAIDAVVGAVLWKRGDWVIDYRATPPAGRQAAVRLFDLMLDGATLRAHWPSIQRSVPSLDLVVQAVRPSDGARKASTVRQMARPGTTIRQIVASNPQSRWTTLREVAELCQRGELVLARPKGPAARRALPHAATNRRSEGRRVAT